MPAGRLDLLVKPQLQLLRRHLLALVPHPHRIEDVQVLVRLDAGGVEVLVGDPEAALPVLQHLLLAVEGALGDDLLARRRLRFWKSLRRASSMSTPASTSSTAAMPDESR